MYSVFKSLMEQKGVSASDVAKATGITASTFTMWKQGKISPNSQKMIKIADYFGVPVEYLLTGEMPAGEGYYIDEETAKTAQALLRIKICGSYSMPPGTHARKICRWWHRF